MTRKWDAIGIINQRIYKELDIIEEESKKSVQMGAVIDRSARIATEMNFLRKVFADKDGGLRFERDMREAADERVEYLEERLREEKAKGRD